MRLPGVFKRKQNAPVGVMRRLSRLPQPPSDLTRALLQHKHDAKKYKPGGVQPFDRAVREFSKWAHLQGYTYQDIHDYMHYVLGVRFVR